MGWQQDLANHGFRKRSHELHSAYLEGIRDAKRGYIKQHVCWYIKVGDLYLEKERGVYDRKTAGYIFKCKLTPHKSKGERYDYLEEGRYHVVNELTRVREKHPKAYIVHIIKRGKLPSTKVKPFNNVIKIG